MPDAGFRVVVEYPADEFDAAIDERIEKCVDCAADFSGCGLSTNSTREIGWYCKTSEEAEAIASSILDGYEGWPPIVVRQQEVPNARHAG